MKDTIRLIVEYIPENFSFTCKFKKSLTLIKIIGLEPKSNPVFKKKTATLYGIYTIYMHHFRNWRAETTSFPFFPKFKRHNSVKYHRTGCIFKAGLYSF